MKKMNEKSMKGMALDVAFIVLENTLQEKETDNDGRFQDTIRHTDCVSEVSHRPRGSR